MRLTRAKVAGFVLVWGLLCWNFSSGGHALAQEENVSPNESSPFQDDAPPVRPAPENGYGSELRAKCPTPEELNEWFKPLDKIKLSSRAVDGPMPLDCSQNLFHASGSASSTRNWSMTEFHWQASNLAAQPAYWDDVPLERYGQTVSPALQPGISGVKFFATFPIIPYMIGVDRTHDLIYTLGYYRPGSPAPQVRQRLPWEMDAAGFETIAIIGMIMLLP